MEENYYKPEEESLNDDTKAENGETLKSKADPYVSIIVMQCIVCAIILLAFFVIKFAFKGYFTEIKNWYDNNVNVDTDINQILNNEQTAAVGGELNEIYLTGLEEMVLPVNGEISSGYGYRQDPFTGEPANHSGIDIAAELGSEIYAALSGKVVAIGYEHSDYGNYVILDHGGFYTLYGHCSELSVQNGQAVSEGEIIAFCGSTGRSTGPHLHFEIRVGGIRIDPTPFLRF